MRLTHSLLEKARLLDSIMQLGGNAPFREFMQSYTPKEQGGYTDGMSPYDTYHCWAATQYREKVQILVTEISICANHIPCLVGCCIG